MQALLALALLAPALQEKNEGADALLKMEKKLQEARALKIQIKGKGVEAQGEKKEPEGGEATVSLAGDNRFHFIWKDDKNSTRLEIAGDGKRVRDGTTAPARPTLRNEVALTIARGGSLAFIGDLRPVRFSEEVDPATVYSAAEPKLGKAEKVGEEEAEVVDYILKIKGRPFLIKTTVWISKKTGFPLRRHFLVTLPDEPEQKDHSLTFDETYVIEADAKLPDELFRVPD